MVILSIYLIKKCSQTLKYSLKGVDVIPIIQFAPTPILHNYDEFVNIINFQPTPSQSCQHSNYRKDISISIWDM